MTCDVDRSTVALCCCGNNGDKVELMSFDVHLKTQNARGWLHRHVAVCAATSEMSQRCVQPCQVRLLQPGLCQGGAAESRGSVNQIGLDPKVEGCNRCSISVVLSLGLNLTLNTYLNASFMFVDSIQKGIGQQTLKLKNFLVATPHDLLMPRPSVLRGIHGSKIYVQGPAARPRSHLLGCSGSYSCAAMLMLQVSSA